MTTNKVSRKERRQQHKRQQQMKSIGYIVIGLLIIVTGFVLISQSGPRINLPDALGYDMADGNAIGDPDAPVVVEEYYSFACGHCSNFANDTLRTLVEEYVYAGQVYYVSNAFSDPLGDVGIAHQAAYCAMDQGKYWEMHDVIFANFSSVGYTQNQLEAMAEEINLDMSTFKQCLRGSKYVDKIIENVDAGSAAGITGTPSFLINGQLAVVGNREYSLFQQQIELALANSGN